MAITSNSMSYILDEVVSAVAFESFYAEQFMMPVLYDVRGSGRRRERSASIGGLSLYAEKTNGQNATEDQWTQQFEKDFVHVAYGKRVAIERELVDDEDYGVLAEIGSQLGSLAAQTMEEKAADLFEDAFAGATYKAEDNLSICNSAHLNADGGNSQDNSGTSALSMAAVKATRTAMRRFKNYRGDRMAVRPDLLIVPPDLEETAWEIIRSTGRPDTTNRADNMYNGMFNLVVWDFLDDTNNWFMADSRLMKQNLLWYQRIPLEIYGDGNLNTGTRTIGGYFRASHGCRDWRWVYGHIS